MRKGGDIYNLMFVFTSILFFLKQKSLSKQLMCTLSDCKQSYRMVDKFKKNIQTIL